MSPGHQQPQCWLWRMVMCTYHISLDTAHASDTQCGCYKGIVVTGLQKAVVFPCHQLYHLPGDVVPGLGYGFHTFRGNKYRSVQTYLYTDKTFLFHLCMLDMHTNGIEKNKTWLIWWISQYTIEQKFSDFTLHVSNLQINLLGLLKKIGIL